MDWYKLKGYLMGRTIKDFSESGIAVDQETIIRIRKEVEDHIIDGMRAKGWVPVIDLLPQLYWDYDADGEEFKFQVVIYGTYVGKKKSKTILGMLDSRPIMMEAQDDT